MYSAGVLDAVASAVGFASSADAPEVPEMNAVELAGDAVSAVEARAPIVIVKSTVCAVPAPAVEFGVTISV